MWLDGLIVIFAVSAVLRGREIGLVRQLGSSIGFFGGLFLGAALQPHTVQLAHASNSRLIITILTTLGCALVFLSLGEYAGLRIKSHALGKRMNIADNDFGSLLGLVSWLLTAWLIAAVIGALPFPEVQAEVHGSRIINVLNKWLPPAPTVIADLGHLISPNGFPQVFIGNEPTPPPNINLPATSALQLAVARDRNSVVKIEGQGCGSVIEGSGFVVSPNDVVTNAHVIAGIRQPLVIDANGSHHSVTIWFDPNTDLAVLRVNDLAGPSLRIDTRRAAAGTAAAVLGYPGGGPFTADAAAVLDEFTATGRNIYGTGNTDRNVYEIQADIIPGNSGGPLVEQDGSVIGVIFAESATYQHVGYALTSDQVASSINRAIARNQAVSTGQCAE